jgi:hypothetical protein
MEAVDQQFQAANNKRMVMQMTKSNSKRSGIGNVKWLPLQALNQPFNLIRRQILPERDHRKLFTQLTLNVFHRRGEVK